MKKVDVQTVIVGLDFSWYSKIVLKEALQLATKMKAPIVAVYVGEKPYSGLSNSLFPTISLKNWYEANLRRSYPALRRHRVIVELGRPHEKIIEVAQRYKKPLIVIGHRGQSIFARLTLGSIAEKISQISPFPVWIHRGDKVVVPKKVLLPCDLESRSIQMPQNLTSIQKTFHTHFEFLYVMQDPTPVLDYELWSTMLETARQTIDRKIANLQKRNPNILIKRSSGDIPKQILRHAKGFDLIALPRRNTRGGRPLFGSVTIKLVRNGEKPVLILP